MVPRCFTGRSAVSSNYIPAAEHDGTAGIALAETGLVLGPALSLRVRH